MGLKTSGAGHFTIPTAPAAGTSCTSGGANGYSAAFVQLIASTGAALFINGILVESANALAVTYIVVQLATGAGGSETSVSEILVNLSTGSTVALGFRVIDPPIPVASGTRISCKTADSVGGKSTLITLQCINQANVVDDGVALGTVTNLTNLPAITANWLTAAGINAGALNGKGDWLLSASYTAPPSAAAIATGVWQDATGSDFSAANSIGKTLYINNAAPGSAGGLLISGSNAGTTTFGALTVTGATTLTGNVALADGLTVAAPSTLNRAGIAISGNGTGAAMSLTGGATGPAAKFIGGGTSGDGIDITTTAGDGFKITPTAGHALVLTANGVSKHGLVSTGGTGGTSDGASFIAGAGGVDLRANITGNLHGTLDQVLNLAPANLDVAVSSRLAPAIAGRALSVTAGGHAGLDWGTITGTANLVNLTNTTFANLTNAPTAGDLTAAMKASVATAVWTQAMVELAAVPGPTASIIDGLTFMFMGIRNRREVTATADKIENNAGAAIGTAVLSDDGTTFTKGKYA